MPTDPWMILFASLQSLRPGEQVRFTRGVDGLYVIADRIEESGRSVSYFAHDRWVPTVEGVLFSEIEPWLRVFSPSGDTSSSAEPSSASPSGSAF